MFHSISWQQFFTAIAIVYALYYLFIGVVYFRKDAFAIIKGQRPQEGTSNSFEKNTAYQDPQEDPAPWEEQDTYSTEPDTRDTETGLFTVAYELAEEIKILLKDAGYRRLIRQELVQALKSLISRPPYDQLAQTGFRNAINNLIATEAMRQCTYELTQEELSMVWTQ